jgi:hypothetical protein
MVFFPFPSPFFSHRQLADVFVSATHPLFADASHAHPFRIASQLQASPESV